MNLDRTLRDLFAIMLEDEEDTSHRHSTASYVKREISAVESMIRTARRWNFKIEGE